MNEIALVALTLLAFALPLWLPWGVAGVGVVAGAGLALQAFGVVLVYRSHRIINFAQVQLGAISGALFFNLARYDQFLYWTKDVCPPCLHGSVTDAPRWAHQANFMASLVLALIVGPLVAVVVHGVLIRRFVNSPRLPVTVVTLALGQVLSVAGRSVGDWIKSGHTDAEINAAGGPGLVLPFPDVHFTIAPSVFRLVDVATLSAAVLASIGLYLVLQRSTLGAVLRGASENPRRAGTLGIDVGSTGGVVWGLAGLLSGLAAVLTQAGGIGFGSDTETYVRILTVLVLARFVSLPLTLVAAVVLQVLEQSFLWKLRSPNVMGGVLVVLIAGALLLQRTRSSRAEREADLAWRGATEIRPVPAELRFLPVVRSWTRWSAAVAVLTLLGLPFVLAPGQTSLASVFLIDAIVGLSLLVLTGWAGQISLGQFALSAIGAYVATLAAASAHLPFPIALLAGGVAGTVVAVLIGIPAIRLRGLNLAISTLALALAVSALVVNPDSRLGGKLPDLLARPRLVGISFEDERLFYYLTLSFLVLAVVACVGIRRSRAGRVLIASRDNESAALAFGINLVRVRLMAFAVSGFLAGLAGALFAYHEHGVKAPAFTPGTSVGMFLMVVIGGLGSIAGPLLGAAYFGALTLVGNDTLTSLGTGLGAILVLVSVQGGLAGAAAAGRDAMLRRVALRQRILVPSLFEDSRGKRLDAPAPVAPKRRPGGGTVFVPPRYRALHDQWALTHHGEG